MTSRTTQVLSALNSVVLAAMLAACSGDNGDPGSSGDAGPAGDVGPQGDRGPAGELGPQGEIGDPGDKGDTGEPGADGTNGEPGADGERGARGDKGDTGDKGDPGSLMWSSVAVPTHVTPDNGYVVTAPVTLTLPPAAGLTIGQEIDLIGLGTAFVVAPSGDETFQAAPGVVASPWADRSQGNPSSGRRWTSVASSASGAHIAAVAYDEQAWTSALSGAGLTAQPATLGGNNNFTSIASDASGAHLVATVAGWAIWTSADYGVTWQQTAPSTPNEYPQWAGASSNADGSQVLAGNPGHSLYIGVNNNGDWTFTAQTNLGNGNWYATASDASGAHLVAGDHGSMLWTTPDAGATWSAQEDAGDHDWTSIATSADGTRVFATAGQNQLWAGVNDAGTWSWQNLPDSIYQLSYRNLGAVTSSADGRTIYTVVEDDVWRGHYADNHWTFDNVTEGTAAANLAWGSLSTNGAGTQLAATVGNASLWTYSESPSALSVSSGGTLRLIYIGDGVFYIASATGYLALQ